jgi:hypothetical protein
MSIILKLKTLFKREFLLSLGCIYSLMFAMGFCFSIFFTVRQFNCVAFCKENVDILVADITWKSITILFLIVAYIGCRAVLHENSQP